jgi:hypothetical protein
MSPPITPPPHFVIDGNRRIDPLVGTGVWRKDFIEAVLIHRRRDAILHRDVREIL